MITNAPWWKTQILSLNNLSLLKEQSLIMVLLPMISTTLTNQGLRWESVRPQKYYTVTPVGGAFYKLAIVNR